MKKNKCVVSFVLAVILAGNIVIPVSASEISSSKEEVVYIMTAIAELADTLTGFMDKLPELTAGIDQLVTNYENFDSGLGEYTNGVATIVSSYNQMLDGISSLASGSKELLDGTEILSSIEGDETEMQSFVSEKNQNVDNVQFVIKTRAIEQENTEQVVNEETAETSLWKKFIQLFGF